MLKHMNRPRHNFYLWRIIYLHNCWVEHIRKQRQRQQAGAGAGWAERAQRGSILAPGANFNNRSSYANSYCVF